MKTDKELALEMLAKYEQFFFEATAVGAVLHSHGRPGWKDILRTLLKDQEMRNRVHEKFQPLAEQILAAPSLEEAVKEMLKDLPRPDVER